MNGSSLVWPHGDIKLIFPNIFMVTGTNQTTYNGVHLQHSRNMIIIRHDKDLTLVNTVRLNEDGLNSLDKLGSVKHVVRIGAFHGRDDGFYLDRYQAKLWALKGMKDEHGHNTDIDLTTNGLKPFPACSLFIFETSKFPEGVLHINREGGILMTCDSIKNWLGPDIYFSEETAKLYQEQGLFGAASISPIWKQTTQVSVDDFKKLLQLSFRHLLSAHGEPLLNDAHKKLTESTTKAFGL